MTGRQIRNGSITAVDLSKRLRATLTKRVTGPAGPRGPLGSTGSRGAPGPTGTGGPAGAPGVSSVGRTLAAPQAVAIDTPYGEAQALRATLPAGNYLLRGDILVMDGNPLTGSTTGTVTCTIDAEDDHRAEIVTLFAGYQTPNGPSQIHLHPTLVHSFQHSGELTVHCTKTGNDRLLAWGRIIAVSVRSVATLPA